MLFIIIKKEEMIDWDKRRKEFFIFFNNKYNKQSFI